MASAGMDTPKQDEHIQQLNNSLAAAFTAKAAVIPDDRLSELLHACTGQALSAHDALPVLFKRPLNVHQTTFAMGESVAHLHMLWLAGQLRRELGEDGIYRFSRAQS